MGGNQKKTTLIKEENRKEHAGISGVLLLAYFLERREKGQAGRQAMLGY